MTIEIDPAELIFRAKRSPGPGGQNVNKVNSASELRFNAQTSRCLPEAVRERLLARRDRRIGRDGWIVIHASRFRSEPRNREDALARLQTMIDQAATPPKRRVPTKPSRAAKARRVNEKTARGQRKVARRPPGADD